MESDCAAPCGPPASHSSRVPPRSLLLLLLAVWALTSRPSEDPFNLLDIPLLFYQAPVCSVPFRGKLNNEPFYFKNFLKMEENSLKNGKNSNEFLSFYGVFTATLQSFPVLTTVIYGCRDVNSENWHRMLDLSHIPVAPWNNFSYSQNGDLGKYAI